MTDASALQTLTNFAAILDYLRDSLDWPIDVDTLDDATYAYSAQELNINPRYAARITDIKQLRPLVNDQAWGIFFVEFDSNRLPVMALRRILQGLAISRRQRDSSLPAWKRDDLLFICVYTSAAPGKTDQRGVTFAHFRDGADGQPELRTFSWDSRETHFYYLRNLNLAGLRWPRDEHDTTAWRDQWRRAFTVTYRYTIRTSEKLASQMAKQARVIRELSADLYDAEDDHGALHVLYERIRHDLLHDLQPDDFADMIAQTITYGAFSAAVQSQREQPAQPFTLAQLADFIPDTNSFLKRMLHTMTTQGQLDLDELGVGELVDLLRQIDLKAITQDFGRQTGSGSEDPVVHFYEQFLNEYDREQRVSRGVFYTPDPVVDYIVRAVDQLLQRPAEDGGFGITDGLASDAVTANGEPLVQILDPATGTGTFLAHVIDHVARRKNPRGQATPAWNDYVAHNLLKRLNGFELMMAPYTIAHLKLGLKLAQTGYSFGTGERLRVFLTNALEKPELMSDVLLETDYLSREANEAAIVKNSKPIMVVIGNPPYSNFGQLNQNKWILSLLDDYKKGLDEKKINLNDDYIKFLRFAHWRIQQTQQGIVAFITNNSFLDGITHRVMRQKLLEDFDEIYIINLHGNSNRKEVTPTNERDENVFDIQQGVNITLLVRNYSHDQIKNARVHYLDLWGSRQQKYNYLGKVRFLENEFIGINPVAPYFFFVPENPREYSEYSHYPSINSVMPSRNAGVVTARDELTIHDTKESLVNTITTFASQSRNEVVRNFNLEDSRDWKIELAQNDLKSKGLDPKYISNILFRPFDVRITYYTGKTRGFISMPGREVMRHMIQGKNLALVTVRQIAESDYSHIYSSRHIIDNRLTLSNRGYAQIFPVYLYPFDDELLDTSEWPLSEHGRRPNLSRAFVAQVAAKLGLRFVTDGRGDLAETFGPEDIFHYAYAIFHSPTYRTRYAEQLKIDFPRLPLTADLDLFRQLVAHGVDLVALHLLEDDYEGASWTSPLPHGEGSGVRAITRFVAGKHGALVGTMNKTRAYDSALKRIYLDSANVKDASYFQFDDSISTEEAEATWNFQIGGYQVLHKWLYDRRASGGESGRVLTEADLTHYQRVVAALYHTRQVMSAIDAVIESHGGFPLGGGGGDDGGEIDEMVDSQEGDSVSSSEWRAEQPKLIHVEGDQLTFGDVETDDEVMPPDSAVEVSVAQNAEEALTQMEGFEVEREESEEGFVEITRPFDPNKIRMTSQQLTLYNFITRMEDGRISIPRYQRAEGIWNEVKQSRLIESILIKIPLPAFYIDATDDDHWRIIDGLQRLTTLRRFVIDKSLRLTGLEFLQIHGGDSRDPRPGYLDLPRNLQRRIEETPVTVYFVQEGTPPEVTYNIFKRINTGGEALSAQEIRNAMNDGPALAFLDKLAKSAEFVQATGNSIKAIRKADQEVVLRFLAFIMAAERRPQNNDIDAFMNDAMKRLNTMPESERQALGQRFIRAMRAANAILGDYAFRKIMPSGRRGQVSRALFDAWSVNFDVLSDQQLARLAQKRPSSRLLGRFRALLSDDVEFNRAITASTGDPSRIQYRYEALERIIHETLGS